MTVSTRTVTAMLIPATGTIWYPLKVVDGRLDMDEAVVPFVGATLTIAHPGLSTLSLIGPGAKVRLQLAKGAGALATTLNVEARQLVAETGEIAINLVSDEALVRDWSPDGTVDYNGAQASILAIVNFVLRRSLGVATTTASFASGADVPFTTTTELDNLIPGGNFETATGLWTANNTTLSLVTGWKQFGSNSLKVTPANTSNQTWATVVVPVSQGHRYTLSAYVRVQSVQTGTLQSTARTFQAVATFQDNNTVSTAIIGRSDQAANTGFTTTRVTMTFVVPPNATSVSVRLVNGASNSADNSIYVDGVLLTEGYGKATNGSTPLDYFDGATPADGVYQYTWNGDAHLSTSTRTPILDRDPDTLVWKPGTGGIEFLQPILQALGLRLFQDIDGSWRLADNDYVAAGQARIAVGRNLYSATDLISRTASQSDGFPLFADAVILRYEWVDELGRTQNVTDMAGPATYTKPYIPDVIEKAYPGPGRAAYMLARLSARRRQIGATGAIDYTVRPGQEAVVTTADGGTQVGYVDAVIWDFGRDEMEVVTKGLISAPAASWFRLAVGVAWSASPTGSSWAAETI